MINLKEDYNELFRKYPELCFKYKIKNPNNDEYRFVLGIITSDGPFCFDTDETLWDSFNIKSINATNSFLSNIKWNSNLTSTNMLEKVCYFIVEEDELIYYFGNIDDVILPNEIKKISSYAFANNHLLKSVKGDNVEYISYYSFIHNKNLEKLDFKNAIHIGNLLDVPNLNTLIIGCNLSEINIETDLSKNFIIVVSNDNGESIYTFNQELEQSFLNRLSATKTDNEEISIVGIDNRTRNYSFTKSDRKEQYKNCISSICLFEFMFSKLPDSIKKLLNNNDYILYLIKDFPYSGMCSNENKLILVSMENIRIALYHEIGHAVDFCLGNISNGAKFKKIYMEEKELLYSNKSIDKKVCYDIGFVNHVKQTESEFFAECFQRYFEKDEVFMRECPQTWNFFSALEYELNQIMDKEQISLKK